MPAARTAPAGYRLNKNRFAPVYIQWIDSAHTSGWQHAGDLVWSEAQLLYETIGFVIHETDYSVSVVQSKSVYAKQTDSHQVDALMEIPKCAIRKLLRLTNIKGR